MSGIEDKLADYEGVSLNEKTEEPDSTWPTDHYTDRFRDIDHFRGGSSGSTSSYPRVRTHTLGVSSPNHPGTLRSNGPSSSNLESLVRTQGISELQRLGMANSHSANWDMPRTVTPAFDPPRPTLMQRIRGGWRNIFGDV